MSLFLIFGVFFGSVSFADERCEYKVVSNNYEDIWHFDFSLDGKSFFFINSDMELIKDGKKIGKYYGLYKGTMSSENVLYSKNGEHFACIIEKNNKLIVMLDGKQIDVLKKEEFSVYFLKFYKKNFFYTKNIIINNKVIGEKSVKKELESKINNEGKNNDIVIFFKKKEKGKEFIVKKTCKYKLFSKEYYEDKLNIYRKKLEKNNILKKYPKQINFLISKVTNEKLLKLIKRLEKIDFNNKKMIKFKDLLIYIKIKLDLEKIIREIIIPIYYDEKKVKKTMFGKEIINQSYILSYFLPEESLIEIINKYTMLKVIGYSESQGVLVEYDEKNYQARKSLLNLKYEDGIVDVRNRTIINDNIFSNTD